MNSSVLSEQVVQLWQRPHELDPRFQGGVNLRLNFRLKGYFLRHCDMTQFMLTDSIMPMFMFRVVHNGHTK